MTVHEALLSELERLPKDLAESALAASALALAREMDSASNSATSKSMCANALHAALRELRDLAPATEEADQLDQLAAKRADRIARSSKASA
jgi:hypothetical protein